MSKKTILVTGATGAQGSSVVKHLLKSNKYIVRALTRDPESAKAKQIEKLGAQLVKGDFNDKASLLQAAKGVYGIYGNTNFWENPTKPEIEFQQAKNLADVAKEVGVQHYVYSSLEDCEKLSGGKYKVPHFDGKARVAEYAKKQLQLPLTEVKLGMYMEAVLQLLKLQDGVYTLTLPLDDKPLDLIAIEDLGGIVTQIFDHPKEWIGKSLGVATEARTGKQIVETFQKSTGKKAQYVPISVDKFKKFGFPGAEELGNMFQFIMDFGTLRDLKKTRELYPQYTSLEAFFKKHAQAFK